jgi:hypothetical protein
MPIVSGDPPEVPPESDAATASTPTPRAGDGAGQDPEPEEMAYFHALEDHLGALRQGWLLLSPQDYEVSRGWWRQGVPLDLVRRTMEEMYARRLARGSRRRISRLGYFARAVGAAWEEVRGPTAPGRRQVAEPMDVAARLAGLAAALPADLEDRASIVARLATLTGDTQEIEAALAALDHEILAAHEAALDPMAQQEIAGTVAASLARLAGRLPEEEIEAARQRLRPQILRRRLRLPVLSLFSPEARGDGEVAKASSD